MKDTSINVDLETSKERVEKERLAKIEAIDAKEVANKCLLAIRQMSPKILGLTNREQDALFKLKQMETRVINSDTRIQQLENDIDELKETLRKSLDIVGKENREILNKISDTSKGGVFRWILVQLKRFLPNKEKN